MTSPFTRRVVAAAIAAPLLILALVVLAIDPAAYGVVTAIFLMAALVWLFVWLTNHIDPRRKQAKTEVEAFRDALEDDDAIRRWLGR